MVKPEHCTLSSRGYGIPKAVLQDGQLDVLKKELTVSPLNTVGTSPIYYKLFLESSKKVYVPKYYGLSKFGIPGSNVIGEGDDIDVVFNGQIRDEQMDPVDKYIKIANDPKKMGGILNIPCGGGKTVIALYIISQLRKKTLIVVHKDFLLDQWKERIAEFLPSAKIGLVKGKIVDIVGKDIVIASLQSLSMKDYDLSVFSSFGFVVIDEVHRTGTEVFSNALHKINFKYSLGLSATVKRKDGLTKVFVWFIGDIAYKRKRDKENVSVYIKEFYDPSPSYSKEEYACHGKLNLSKMLNNVCAYRPRLIKIIDIIKAQESERKILVLSDRKSQLYDIRDELVRLHIPCGFYIGGMKQNDLKESETKKVILATFSFASEGFDAKNLDTLILASPKTDIEQSVGRILRQKEADRLRIPTIYDIVDKFSIFAHQGKKRVKFYSAHGYTLDIDGLPEGNFKLDTGGVCLL